MSFSRAPPSDAPPPTHRDSDVAQMARQALFPKKINRDGSHSTIFPAVQALARLRQDLVERNPNLANSTIFPKGVVVVKEIGLDTLTSNGQPNIDEKGASFQVIPKMLSVKCMECNDGIPKDVQAYLFSSKTDESEQEIVLCSNRLVKKDYKPSTTESSSFLDIPPRSYAAVEEALAHQVTLVTNELERNDNNSNKLSCTEMAASELKAAHAAECFYETSDSSVKRGSCLPIGYSILPTFLQTRFMNKCLQSVATRAVAQQFGTEQGRQCVEEVMKNEQVGASSK